MGRVEPREGEPNWGTVESRIERVNEPQKAAGKPQKAAGKPQKAAGKPQKADEPQKAAGKPQKAAGKRQSRSMRGRRHGRRVNGAIRDYGGGVVPRSGSTETSF